MSDLTWLNPTPHAIAVSASRPLSPGVTNTRYQADATPYLGRTSTGRIAPALPGALIDHLVGAGEQRWRNVQTEGLGGLEVDNQLVLGRRLHRQVGRLRALEDTIDVAGHLPVLVDPIRSV